jgi:hypothetical protein
MAAVIKEPSSHLGGGPGAVFSAWSLYVLIAAGPVTMLLAGGLADCLPHRLDDPRVGPAVRRRAPGRPPVGHCGQAVGLIPLPALLDRAGGHRPPARS